MENKCYILVQNVMNGTIVIKTDYSVYPSLKIAEKVVSKLKEVNDDGSCLFTCNYKIVEANYYQTENDVPVLVKKD